CLSGYDSDQGRSGLSTTVRHQAGCSGVHQLVEEPPRIIGQQPFWESVKSSRGHDLLFVPKDASARSWSYFRYSCSIRPLFSISLKKLASTKSAGAKFLIFGSVSRSSTAWSALSLGAGNRSNKSTCSS